MGHTYILLALSYFFSFSIWAKFSNDLLNCFSRFFYGIKVFDLILSIRTFLWFIRGRCLDINFRQNWRTDFYWISWCFKTDWKFWVSQFQLINVKWHNFCYILRKFNQNWSSNPKDYDGKNCHFWTRRQNRHMSLNILASTSPNFQRCYT